MKQIESYHAPKYESGMGVFNGELGTIIKINEQDKTLTIKFDDGKQADYMLQDLDQIEHAYSITVHKSQRKWIWRSNNGSTTSLSNATNKKPFIHRNDKSKKATNSNRRSKYSQLHD